MHAFIHSFIHSNSFETFADCFEFIHSLLHPYSFLHSSISCIPFRLPVGPLEEAEFDYEVVPAPASSLVPGAPTTARRPTVGVRPEPHRRFVWNGHLLAPAERQMGWEWRLYLIHGYIKQATLYLHGRHLFLTLIARRSRWVRGSEE